MKPPPSTQGGHVDRSDPRHQIDILFITDRRFWHRSIGSEQRIAALIVHLARLRERVTCVYVGRVTGSERVLLSKFLSSTTGLEVVSRPSHSKTLWRGIRNRLRRLARLEQNPQTPAIAADPMLGTPSHTLVVASSEGHSEGVYLVPDETGFHHAAMDGLRNPDIRADMTFFETPGGGAVFSVGSIAWGASLSHNGYDNNVSRITENVVRRFADSEPFSMPK